MQSEGLTQAQRSALRSFARDCRASGLTLFGTIQKYESINGMATDEERRALSIYYDMDV